jgi:hypothetical protein
VKYSERLHAGYRTLNYIKFVSIKIEMPKLNEGSAGINNILTP